MRWVIKNVALLAAAGLVVGVAVGAIAMVVSENPAASGAAWRYALIAAFVPVLFWRSVAEARATTHLHRPALPWAGLHGLGGGVAGLLACLSFVAGASLVLGIAGDGVSPAMAAIWAHTSEASIAIISGSAALAAALCHLVVQLMAAAAG